MYSLTIKGAENIPVLHFVDRFTRWQVATIITGKNEYELKDALDDKWVTQLGAPRELISDQEGGLQKSNLVAEYCERQGIRLVPRAKEQHARYAERRGALLRDAIHPIGQQFSDFGVGDIPFKEVLNQAVFAGNALLSVGGCTPYAAVYGRVPAIP